MNLDMSSSSGDACLKRPPGALPGPRGLPVTIPARFSTDWFTNTLPTTSRDRNYTCLPYLILDERHSFASCPNFIRTNGRTSAPGSLLGKVVGQRLEKKRFQEVNQVT